MQHWKLVLPNKLGWRERFSPSKFPSKGPSAVTNSVYVGLKRLGVRFSVMVPSQILNTSIASNDSFLFFAHGDCSGSLINLLRMNARMKAPLIIGPNCEFNINVKRFMIENPTSYTSVILPTSEMLIDRLQSKIKYSVWPAGVDEKFWKPNNSSKEAICLYQKGKMSSNDEQLIKEIQKWSKNRIEIMQYGNYTRNSYRQLLNNSRALIWLGVKETQGIAIAEAWSMNVPTLIRVAHSDDSLKVNRSTAPLLNVECGKYLLLTDNQKHNLNQIEDFLTNLFVFKPREWVLDNLTSKLQVKKLLDFAH